ncbi:MAG: transglutaminase-like domain-containing protein [Flavobacteriales bacterium]|nr:transglutaminase-like domain-containing protein [Flavobacteriales bacterium]
MEQLNEKEFQALISLLDDTDQDVYQHVRDKLLSVGEEAIPLLEEAWESSFNHLLQQRIEELIHKIQFDTLCIKLNQWKQSKEQDLLEGCLLIARYQYPDLNEEPIRKTIEKIKKDVWIELNESQTALEKTKIINHILFDVYNFTSNKANFHSPPNNYINQVIETRKGNPLTLCIVYIIVAQSLRIPIYGVNLPEHFILAYTDAETSNIASLPIAPQYQKVLFYINPFSKGSIFSKREIDSFLQQLGIEKKPQYYIPCSTIEILIRMLNNLMFAYKNMGYEYKVDELMKLKEILNP